MALLSLIFKCPVPGREENCSAGGEGVTRKPIPPPPSLAAMTGGGVQGGGARPAVPGGGGVNPTSMAQNDTHVALIILNTQMWGGGIIGGKKFFGPNFVFLCLWRQHLFLHKTKGPTRKPISPTPPPPPPSAGVHVTPPPPPAEQFSGCPAHESQYGHNEKLTHQDLDRLVPMEGVDAADSAPWSLQDMDGEEVILSRAGCLLSVGGWQGGWDTLGPSLRHANGHQM